MNEHLTFEDIAKKTGLPENQIEIALRGIRTKNANPKRATLNIDPYSKLLITQKSKAWNMPE